jgi:hypothetical protein
MKSNHRLRLNSARQTGIALLALLALLGIAVVGGMLSANNGTMSGTYGEGSSSGAATEAQRARVTRDVLRIAKFQLMAYAYGMPLQGTTCDVSLQDASGFCPRPGELPCPDRNNDGVSDRPCATAALRVGRLPWKTLGLPDLRDGYDERLWYALSSSFADSPRGTCNVPGQAGCLNSNSKGTITVRSPGGAVENNATIQTSAAVAVVIAPGSALTRVVGSYVQDRSCAGDSNVASCQATQVCSGGGPTYTATALCNPINYLDVANTPVSEDNVDFADGATTNGFIRGPIKDSSGDVQVNDSVTALGYSDIMPMVEQRVAGEVMRCLESYAAQNSGRYPFAARIDQFATTGYFDDFSGNLFGRVPDSSRLVNTWSAATTRMSASWTSDCLLGFSNTAWWMNWKELVFYGVAQAYAPTASPFIAYPTPLAAPTGCTGSDCLVVNPPSATNDKRVVVLMTGRALVGQTRATDAARNAITNYLEGTNTSHPTFARGASSATFNDVVLFR